MKTKYTNLPKIVLLVVLMFSLVMMSGMIANAEEEKVIKIGIVSLSVGDIYLNAGRWACVKEMEKLEKEGYKLEWFVESSFEPIKQLEFVETMINIPVDIAYIEPVDGTMTVMIDRFYEAGIPVVCKNSDVLGGAFHPYIAMGNYDCAVQAANALIEVCERAYGPTPEDWVKKGGQDGHGVIINIAGRLSQTIAKERYDGFLAVWQPIADKTPGLEILTKPYDWEVDKAYAIAQDMWTLYGDEIIGIFSAGDRGLTAGVVPAFKAAGAFRKVGEPGHIPLVAIDGTPECLRLMREKEIDVVIVQDAYGEGRVTALVMKKLLKGEPLDEIGTVLWEGIKPLVMEVFPDQYGPEYKDAVEPWAPVTVVERVAGVQYKTNVGVCTSWGFGIPPDSKLLWGNVMAFIEKDKWPWE